MDWQRSRSSKLCPSLFPQCQDPPVSSCVYEMLNRDVLQKLSHLPLSEVLPQENPGKLERKLVWMERKRPWLIEGREEGGGEGGEMKACWMLTISLGCHDIIYTRQRI